MRKTNSGRRLLPTWMGLDWEGANLSTIKPVAYLLPAGFLVLLELLRQLVLAPFLPRWAEGLLLGTVMLSGVALFATAVFRLLEGMHQRVLDQALQLASLHGQSRRRAEQLASLNDAALAMTSDLGLESVLQHVVELSRQVVAAKYAALALLPQDKEGVTRFFTSGSGEEEKAAIGQLPSGRGLLGLLLHQGQALRLRNLQKHPSFSGFPPGHPSMESFLGVPIVYKGQPIGNLYLAEKEGAEEFNVEDEQLLTLFARQAAIAIENARLYEKVQALVVLEERERIGRDLHDGIIQSIYAAGLGLEDIAGSMGQSSPAAKVRLDHAVDSLNAIVRDIRNYIYRLRPQAGGNGTLREGLGELAQEFSANTSIPVQLEIQEKAWRLLDGETAGQLLHISREALANAAKHAKAHNVRLSLTTGDSRVRLRVEDDGRGFDPLAPRGAERQGLKNMAERAQALGGRLHLSSSPGQGTVVELELPIPSGEKGIG